MRQSYDHYRLVTIDVLYYMPDYHLINSFLWQTYDYVPKYPRIAEFLDHWRREIDAVIKEIRIADNGGFTPAKFSHVDHSIRFH